MKKILFFLLYFFPVLLNVSVIFAQVPLPLVSPAEGLMQEPTACLASLTARSWPPVRYIYRLTPSTTYGGTVYNAARRVAVEKIGYDSALTRRMFRFVSWFNGGTFDEASWDNKSNELGSVYKSITNYGKELARIRGLVLDNEVQLRKIYAVGPIEETDYDLLESVNGQLKKANDKLSSDLRDISKKHKLDPSMYLDRFAPVRDDLDALTRQLEAIDGAKHRFLAKKEENLQNQVNHEIKRSPFSFDAKIYALSKWLRDYRVDHPYYAGAAACAAGIVAISGTYCLFKNNRPLWGLVVAAAASALGYCAYNLAK